MEPILVVNGIAGTKILHSLRETFFKLTGMEFSFVDFKGRAMSIPKYACRLKEKPFSLKNKKNNALPELLGKACDEAASTKKPYVSSHKELLFAVVPVVVHENVICMVFLPWPRSINSAAKQQIEIAAKLLFIMVSYIFKNEFDHLTVFDPDKHYSRNQEAIIKAMVYIKSNYHNKDISLQKVASEVSLSHYYFSHIFKNELKITFIEYLTKVRVDAAARLLKNRKLNINQVAYAVGYQDPVYFSKVFKRYTKTSPVEHRQGLFKGGVGKQLITE